MGLRFRKSGKKWGCFTTLLLVIGICLALVFSPFLWMPGIVSTIIFALVKHPKKKRNLLLSSSVTIISFFIFYAIASKPSPDLTGIEVEWNASEYDIADSTEVKISPIPDTAEIESLTLSENSVASLKYKDGKAIVTFKTKGTEELYFIANNDIKSNSKIINVTNQKEEAERIAAEQAEVERIAAEQAEAERIAAEQAEAERIAAEQAEAQRIAAEQAEAQRIAAEQAEAQQKNQERMVWISQTGSKYHRKPDCGKMDPSSAYQMSVSEAKAQGYAPCSKCF